MKFPSRFLSILGFVPLCALSALAQGPGASGNPSVFWRDVEKQLGLPTTYSVDMSIATMGMTMESRLYRNGDKSRTEMTMPFMNLQMAALEIPENGSIATYSLFPEKKKYMADPNDADDSLSASPAPVIEDLGTETYEGVACAKRRVLMELEGVQGEMTLLLSPQLQGMPVKITMNATMPAQPGQPAMPIQSVVLFKNYDFSTPADSLFVIPEDYTRIQDMMEVMMDGGAEGFGALLQQMQQTQPAE